MPNLSTHFTLQEFTATNQKLANVPGPIELANLAKAAAMMEKVRALLGHPITVNSAYRSPALNKAVGGSATSDHVKGLAVDFVCPAFGTPFEVATAIAASGIIFDQLIFENATAPVASQWVHISAAPRARRQRLTMKRGVYYAGIIR